MLREIFGKAITHIVGGDPTLAESATANMLGTAFGVFNSGILFFGAIILTWVTVFGITNSANDGQVLGKKWSTFYTPLRTFTASAFLIPSTSGYSGVQLAILLIVSWSVGFASNMWGKVVDYVVNDQAVEQAVKSIQEDPNFDQMAYNALRMQVCAHAVAQGVNQTMGQGSANLQRTSVENKSSSIFSSGTTTYTTTVMMRDLNWSGSEDVCGKLVLTNTYMKPDTHSSAAQEVASGVRNAVNTIRFKYAYNLLDPSGEIGSIAKEVIQVAENEGQTISAQAVNARVVALRSQMMTEITQEVRRQVAVDNTALTQKFKERGWVMAGSLHRELAHIKDSIRAVTVAKSEYVPGSANVSHLLTPGIVTTSVQTVMARYDALVATLIQKTPTNAASTTGRPALPSLQTNFTSDDFTDSGNSIKSRITTYFNKLPDWLMQGLVFYLAEDGTDPVMQVKNIGDWMATYAEAVMLSKATATAGLAGALASMSAASQQHIAGFSASALGAPVIGALTFLLRLIIELWALISPSVTAVLYAGYFLGIWIPMVPFYVVALAVIGWLVQVVESLAAGGLWMMMHLTPERDDSFIGSQQQGYMLLLSLFARPALTVLGIVASMAILNPAIRFINAGFLTAFRFNQADSVIGLLSIVGYMVIYCMIILAVFMLVFSLPQTLPDRILKWIGAGIGDLGEQNSIGRIESGASSSARMAATSGAGKQAAIASAKGAQVDRAIQSDIRHALQDMAKGGGSSHRGNEPEGHNN